MTFSTSLLTSTVSDGRNTKGMTPVYRPMLNGEEFDIQVSQAQFTMSEYQHDEVTLSASSDSIKDTTTLVGASISFYFGLAPRTELFHGYVNSVTDDASASSTKSLTFTISILGATKEMQSGSPRFWINQSIPSVTETLAYIGLLGSHRHEDNFQWATLAQTDESDWKFICNLAKRMGWSIFTRYGVVMCYNPLRLFIENGSYIPLVSSQYNSTDFADYERALVEFVPIEDSEASYRNIGGALSYFVGDTVQTLTQQGDYTLFKHLSGVPVRNREEANIYVTSKNRSCSDWKQQATARVLGNANIYPGMNVDIHTSNPQYWRDRYNGRWLVREVQHKMDRQSFQTQLSLARPDSQEGMQIVPYVPFWTEANKARPALTLVGGKWNSSWTNKNVRNIYQGATS